jgi:hypothetical protein
MHNEWAHSATANRRKVVGPQVGLHGDHVVACPVGTGRLWWVAAFRAGFVRPIGMIGAFAQVSGVWACAL